MKKLLLLLFVILLTSCGASKLPDVQDFPTYNNSIVVNQPYNQVWTKLVAFVSSNSVSIDMLDKENGYISTKGYAHCSMCRLCDTAKYVNSYVLAKIVEMRHTLRGNIKYNILVTPMDTNNTKVTINTTTFAEAYVPVGEAIVLWDWKYTSIETRSSGKLEQMVIDYIK